MSNLKEWYKHFFNLYPLADLTPQQETDREVRFLLNHLGLRRGQKLLDVGCGVGRHAIPAAQKGVLVTGVDSTASYLRMARERADRASLEVRWLETDMRRIPFKGEFDAAISMFTSFGYFTRPPEDASVVKQIHRALKAGGSFFIDVVNGDRVLGWAENERKNWTQNDSGFVLEDAELRRGADPSCVTRWVFIKEGQQIREAESFTRLYTKARLEKLLKSCGFRAVKFWGDYDGSAHGPKSKRLMILSKKG